MSAGVTIEQKKWWDPIANGFRWVVFLPGGLLGGLLAALAFGILGALVCGFSGEAKIIAPIWSAIAVGYVSVVCAAIIAPTRNKAIPAITMAVGILLLYGAAMFLCAVQRECLEMAKCIFTGVAVAFALHHFVTIRK